MTPQPSIKPGMRVVGFDPFLRNWGIAKGIFIPGPYPRFHIEEIDVINRELPTGKQVRQNSLDLNQPSNYVLLPYLPPRMLKPSLSKYR